MYVVFEIKILSKVGILMKILVKELLKNWGLINFHIPIKICILTCLATAFIIYTLKYVFAPSSKAQKLIYH